MSEPVIKGAPKLACPACGGFYSLVRDSRGSVGSGQAIWRRRDCQECGYTFTTREQIVPSRNSRENPTNHNL